MNITIGFAALVLAAIGLFGAVILVLAAHFMNVPEDERISKVLACMPGANCGACGYAGCADYAKAIVAGAPVNKCVPGGAASADAAAAVMGVSSGEMIQRKAVVACSGSYAHTQHKYIYEGIPTCAACAVLYSGHAACQYGCLGFGDCAKACSFGAISVVEGLARIDREKCTGCGACERVCPKHIIHVLTASEQPIVLCTSCDRGAAVRKVCSAGCIGCMKCEKSCPADAIHVTENLARVDYEKCTGCGQCETVCPVHVISIPKLPLPPSSSV